MNMMKKNKMKMKKKSDKPMQSKGEASKGYGNQKKAEIAANSSMGRYNQPKGEMNKMDKSSTKNVKSMKF